MVFVDYIAIVGIILSFVISIIAIVKNTFAQRSSLVESLRESLLRADDKVFSTFDDLEFFKKDSSIKFKSTAEYKDKETLLRNKWNRSEHDYLNELESICIYINRGKIGKKFIIELFKKIILFQYVNLYIKKYSSKEYKELNITYANLTLNKSSNFNYIKVIIPGVISSGIVFFAEIASNYIEFPKIIVYPILILIFAIISTIILNSNLFE